MPKASDAIAVAWITKCYNRRRTSSGVKLIPRLSAKILPFFFNTRYWLARQTRKHKHFGNFIRKRYFDGDDMVVLPKDSVVKDVNVNISIDSAGDRTILPSDVVKALIDRTDDIFIMNFCLCRKSNNCKDYPIDHGCVFLGKGIRKIPEKFGRVATKDEAKAYIDECTELGFVHIIGRNKLDSMWLHTGDKKDLMSICNCCPCCCLWNMVRDISDDIAGTYRRMDGVSVSVDTEKCIGCGKCEKICFTKAISIVNGKSVLDDKCRGCGRCVEICPQDAISISFDDTKVGSEIERIEKLVNLSEFKENQ